MKLEPSDSLVYLYYDCSDCGERGDEVRLKMAQQSHATHVCVFCGNVDQIKQIKKVKVSFCGNVDAIIKIPFDSFYDKVIPQPHVRLLVKNLLKNSGYTDSEAQLAIKRAIQFHAPLKVSTEPFGTDELFRKAVLEHDKATP